MPEPHELAAYQQQLQQKDRRDYRKHQVTASLVIVFVVNR
jgi:hypothetical protein